ncbi:Bgt-51665 [Blumeria graminis f. sp. tritici]|uniref:Bgt-51665 n=1 Tax=Blumeria graminis f. sp. tritici TaxID=62690 RepID=A0A9X9QBU6_BLUGR|nr:Bgt-51665 [Blumeria graminis f. sp. tritici]
MKRTHIMVHFIIVSSTSCR